MVEDCYDTLLDVAYAKKSCSTRKYPPKRNGNLENGFGMAWLAHLIPFNFNNPLYRTLVL